MLNHRWQDLAAYVGTVTSCQMHLLHFEAGWVDGVFIIYLKQGHKKAVQGVGTVKVVGGVTCVDDSGLAYFGQEFDYLLVCHFPFFKHILVGLPYILFGVVTLVHIHLESFPRILLIFFRFMAGRRYCPWFYRHGDFWLFLRLKFFFCIDTDNFRVFNRRSCCCWNNQVVDLRLDHLQVLLG